jgi:hypothetical protein
MKIEITESQFNRLMSVDEIGNMGRKRWEFKPISLKQMKSENETQKNLYKGKVNNIWKNKLNLDGLMDYAFGDSLLFNVYLHDNENILGQITLSKFEDGYSVIDIHFSESISGKELGLKIYLSLIKILNSPLYSGDSQTSFSRLGIWDKLINRYPDRVVGFHNGSDQYLETREGELYAGDCVVYAHDEDCGDVRLKLLP